jgi:hypothetical protein
VARLGKEVAVCDAVSPVWQSGAVKHVRTKKGTEKVGRARQWAAAAATATGTCTDGVAKFAGKLAS